MATQTELPPSNLARPSPLIPGAPADAKIASLRALQADDDHAGAAAGASLLLETHPADRDLLLIAAHSLRMAKQTNAALAKL